MWRLGQIPVLTGEGDNHLNSLSRIKLILGLMFIFFYS